MRKISIPEIEFSRWYSWKNRSQIPLNDLPGVYIMAVSAKILEGKKPSFSEMDYVGMTVSKEGLKKRWSQVSSSINRPGGNHSGGRSMFAHLGPYKNWNKKLFVSAFPIDKDFHNPIILKIIVSYLEQLTKIKIIENTGTHPKYNKE